METWREGVWEDGGRGEANECKYNVILRTYYYEIRTLIFRWTQEHVKVFKAQLLNNVPSFYTDLYVPILVQRRDGGRPPASVTRSILLSLGREEQF